MIRVIMEIKCGQETYNAQSMSIRPTMIGSMTRQSRGKKLDGAGAESLKACHLHPCVCMCVCVCVCPDGQWDPFNR